MKESKVILKTKAFSVAEELFELEGKRVERFTVYHPGAAVFLPIDSDGSLLFVEQFRAPVRCALLEAPAGTLEVGEDPLHCAQREIQEEVKYAAKEWFPLGVIYPAPGFCNEKQYLFLAKDLFPSSLPEDQDEDITLRRLSVSEVKEAISSGVICDAKTIALFFRAEQSGLFR